MFIWSIPTAMMIWSIPTARMSVTLIVILVVIIIGDKVVIGRWRFLIIHDGLLVP